MTTVAETLIKLRCSFLSNRITLVLFVSADILPCALCVWVNKAISQEWHDGCGWLTPLWNCHSQENQLVHKSVPLQAFLNQKKKKIICFHLQNASSSFCSLVSITEKQQKWFHCICWLQDLWWSKSNGKSKCTDVMKKGRCLMWFTNFFNSFDCFFSFWKWNDSTSWFPFWRFFTLTSHKCVVATYDGAGGRCCGVIAPS